MVTFQHRISTSFTILVYLGQRQLALLFFTNFVCFSTSIPKRSILLATMPKPLFQHDQGPLRDKSCPYLTRESLQMHTQRVMANINICMQMWRTFYIRPLPKGGPFLSLYCFVFFFLFLFFLLLRLWKQFPPHQSHGLIMSLLMIHHYWLVKCLYSCHSDIAQYTWALRNTFRHCAILPKFILEGSILTLYIAQYT